MNNVEARAWHETGHGRGRSGGAEGGTVGLVVIHALIFGVAPRPPPAPLRGIAEQVRVVCSTRIVDAAVKQVTDGEEGVAATDGEGVAARRSERWASS